jgi:hypothetical protein
VLGTGRVTCPRCLREIPNPAVPEGSSDPGAERTLAIDAEVRGDRGRIGCGVVLLLSLLILGLAFGWSFDMAHTRTAGRNWDNLFSVWFGVGGIGAILVLILATSPQHGRSCPASHKLPRPAASNAASCRPWRSPAPCASGSWQPSWYLG